MTPLEAIAALHFLRPAWLWALVLLPLLAWAWRRRQRRENAWRDLVDPHLLAHLLDVRGDRRGRAGAWIAALTYLLAVMALAGPTWRQSSQPLWQSRTPLVIALDLSSAALAADLPPSRLAQARAKLATLLHERKGGEVGLVAFAADAFTVAPLTDDAANVALFLDALQPDVMPRDGQRAGAAIDWSTRLLQRAGARRGDILVLTDHADSVAVDAAADAASSGYRVSVLGLGTDAGSSYRRVDGSIARARLDAASLRKLANAGNGRYAPLSGDDADLRSLQLLDVDLAQASGTGRSGLAWRDEGYWLLPPLLVLMLFAFRRRSGAAWSLVLLCVALPMGNVRAADLWRRPDQAAYARVRQGNEAYRRGDFAAAAQAYRDVDSALAHYNRGNALAKAGQYPQAIAAYDEALRRQPGMADAIYNKHAVQAAMKRQQSSSSDGGKPQQSQKGQGNQQTNPQSGHAPQPDTGQSQAKSPDSRQDRDKQDTQQAGQPSNTPPAKPQDAQSQADADRAQRERMQRALQQRRDRAAKQRADTAQPGETPEQRERRLANDAWLRRVPDDPGGLLRAKFRLEYERRAASGRIEQ